MRALFLAGMRAVGRVRHLDLAITRALRVRVAADYAGDAGPERRVLGAADPEGNGAALLDAPAINIAQQRILGVPPEFR